MDEIDSIGSTRLESSSGGNYLLFILVESLSVLYWIYEIIIDIINVQSVVKKN